MNDLKEQCVGYLKKNYIEYENIENKNNENEKQYKLKLKVSFSPKVKIINVVSFKKFNKICK
jgi:hypothetical protein